MAFELVAHAPGDVGFPGFREAFQTSRDIDAIAVYVAIIGDHIAGIDADAESYLVIAIGLTIPLGNAVLYIERATYCVGRAVKFD
jgi:hypothetical protein